VSKHSGAENINQWACFYFLWQVQ